MSLQWSLWVSIVPIGLLQYAVVSERHESPLVYFILSESHDYPVVSLSQYASSSLYESHESPLVSWVTSSLWVSWIRIGLSESQ